MKIKIITVLRDFKSQYLEFSLVKNIFLFKEWLPQK